jgi:phage tail tube protein FII
MVATVYSMESVNLICGDTGNESQPGFSTHLMLNELKLPSWEENYIDHAPGGAPVAIEINSHLNRLECSFSLAGMQPDIMQLIARSLRSTQSYTAYGLVRDQKTGNALKAQAIMWGRMGKVSPTNFRKGDKFGHEYSIRGIVHYELYMQAIGASGQIGVGDISLDEIYWWDFFEPAFRVGGFDIKAEERAMLGIVGSTL